VSNVITEVQERSKLTTEEAQQAESAIGEIQAAVSNISSMNVQIATATDEQSRVTMEITESVTLINDMSSENQRANEELGQVSKNLNQNSLNLSQLVSRFKTD
ncbi:methyl-accepting chemotaxis protein, partial [Thalassospira xiamenensis]